MPLQNQIKFTLPLNFQLVTIKEEKVLADPFALNKSTALQNRNKVNCVSNPEVTPEFVNVIASPILI